MEFGMIGRQRDVASNPPIEAFNLEEKFINGVSMPCGEFAVIIEKKMEVTCSQVRLSERKPSPEEKVAHCL